MNTFTQIIDAFGYAKLAKALGASKVTVHSWKRRNTIPPDKWLRVEDEAKRRGIPVDLGTLAQCAANKNSF